MRAAAIIMTACVALSGCTVQLYGKQSTAGGATTTTTASSVRASTTAGNARIGFSSGQPVSPNAQGGFLRLTDEAAAALVIGLILLDTVNYLSAQFSAPAAAAGPQPQRRPTDAISETCSCYGYQGGQAPASR